MKVLAPRRTADFLRQNWTLAKAVKTTKSFHSVRPHGNLEGSPTAMPLVSVAGRSLLTWRSADCVAAHCFAAKELGSKSIYCRRRNIDCITQIPGARTKRWASHRYKL